MPYSAYGPRDSREVDVGDVGFSKLNQRLRPDQLGPGEVAESQNGRMEVDGAWQPRKGLETIGGTLTSNTRAIVLGAGTWRLAGPFNPITFAAASFVGAGGEVVIEVNGGVGAGPSTGEIVLIINTNPAGSSTTDINGSYAVYSGGNPFSIITSATAGETWTGGTARWGGSNVISSATRSTTTVTVTTAISHGLSNGQIACISGLTGTIDPNGNRIVTVISTTQFTFTIAGATGSETYSGSGLVEGAELSGTETNGVYGACRFSDPNDDNEEYILRATNLNVVATKVSDGTSSNIAYPDGVTIADRCALLQCFDKVILFREGLTSLEWNGSFSGTPAFTLVANGTYTQPTYFDAANNTTIADGVVTVTAASHGLSVGTRVFVVNAGTTFLNENGGGYTVASVPGSGSFTIRAQVPDSSATTVVWSRRISSGQGFMHSPAPAWGVYHQRRLWVPYAYESSGSSGTPTITDRGRKDELIASDILDSDTFDRIANQFRVTAGTADYLVGATPFAEDNLLIFNRNSIHLATGISGSLTDVRLNLVTAEIGCVARNTIVQVGNEVLFLSDNGIYSANFGDLYNLRGAGLPLSAAVQPVINRINGDAAKNAAAVYFSNRYYIALPLDDSEKNNVILVYNFLNQAWESLDTVDSDGWDVLGFVAASSGGINRLFTVSANGALHEVDARADGQDRLSLFAGVDAAIYPVESVLTTRQYIHGTIDRKSFTSYELHVESDAGSGSNATISAEVENPDWSGELATLSDKLDGVLAPGEDASVRGRIGNRRGYGLQLTVEPSTGRPKVRAAKVSATVTNMGSSQAT